MFIRPDDLRRKLTAVGFKVGPFVGMGPRGVTRKLDVAFGTLPTLAIQYLGRAQLEDRATSEAARDIDKGSSFQRAQLEKS